MKKNRIVETDIKDSQALLDTLQDHVRESRRFSIARSDFQGVTLHTRANWATWGAKIRCELSPLKAGATLTLTWSPDVPTTLIEYGQAKRDLDRVEEWLIRGAAKDDRSDRSD